MSRTDAHVPLFVRVARHEFSAVPEHRCGLIDCDLSDPDVYVHWSTERRRCFWRWQFDGTHVCSCEMCHGGRANRAERRRARHGAAAEARRAVRRWNGGDRAFD